MPCLLDIYEQDNGTARDMQPDGSDQRRRHADTEDCLAARERFSRFVSGEPVASPVLCMLRKYGLM